MPRRSKRSREQVIAHPDTLLEGVDAELFSAAMTRWSDSGYDRRLLPYAWYDELSQRHCDLYDAWVNLGYPDDSPYWPPRTLRGRVLHGKDPDGKRAVSREGERGYQPLAWRMDIWGIGGALYVELEERGTLATKERLKVARPGNPMK